MLHALLTESREFEESLCSLMLQGNQLSRVLEDWSWKCRHLEYSSAVYRLVNMVVRKENEIYYCIQFYYK